MERRWFRKIFLQLTWFFCCFNLRRQLYTQLFFEINESNDHWCEKTRATSSRQNMAFFNLIFIQNDTQTALKNFNVLLNTIRICHQGDQMRNWTQLHNPCLHSVLEREVSQSFLFVCFIVAQFFYFAEKFHSNLIFWLQNHQFVIEN